MCVTGVIVGGGGVLVSSELALFFRTPFKPTRKPNNSKIKLK